MEQLEKVEKLRQRANVSYEDAKIALEENNWDLLDAMVYLEQLGKVEAPNNTSYSTSYEEQPQYLSVPDTINSQDADDARKYKGTGLGLSIAKWIVDKHGGHFEILSRSELGTRIRIVLG